MPDTITLRQAARDALDVQDACNLSGVAHSFLQAVQAVNAEMRDRGEGTEWRNNHPIIRLYVDKLASMAGVQGWTDLSGAYAECREIAGRTHCATCGQTMERPAVTSGAASVCDRCADEATRDAEGR